MKKIFIGLAVLSVFAMAQRDSDRLVLELYDAKIITKYKCEPKESSWYEFNTSKDDELEKICGNKTKGFQKVKKIGYFADEDLFSYDKKIYFDEVPEFNKISLEKVLKDIKSEVIPSSYINKLYTYKSVKYKLFIQTPYGDKELLEKGVVDDKSSLIYIPKYTKLKTYTNTYSISSMKDCIDGEIWHKLKDKKPKKYCEWVSVR